MATDGVVHLIDDDDGVRQSLAFLLASARMAVRVYESASAFIEALGTLQPGCIVSDVRMPGIDGLQLLRRLQALGVHSPVIIITGHADVSLAVEAMKAGAVDFIEKPFDDEAILSAIRIALDHYDHTGRRDTEVVQIQTKLQSLSVREREYVEAARALGASDFRIMTRHVLPNILQPLVVQAAIGMAGAVLAEATLSFLGLGVPPPTASWGSMLNDARSHLFDSPHLVVFPAAAVMLCVLSFNFIGDALRDWMDPRTRMSAGL